MSLDPLSVSNWLMILTAWAAAFLIALWLSLVVWTYRDIRSRSRDALIRFLAVILVTLLFIPGIVVYLILRPARTLEQEYQQTLEEEALLQAIDEAPLCPGCSRRVKESWMICPNCHTKLRKPCHQCGKLMELAWNLCPFCGAPAPGMRRENLTMEEALRAIPVQAETDEEAEPVVEDESMPDEEAQLETEENPE